MKIEYFTRTRVRIETIRETIGTAIQVNISMVAIEESEVNKRLAAWAGIFAVATDMPFLRPALIEQLANYRSGVDAVVPLVDGHPQPLAAFYSIDALPAVRALATGEGKRSLRAALERLQVAYVHAADLITADPGLDSFVDLDTPEDLAKAIDQKEG